MPARPEDTVLSAQPVTRRPDLNLAEVSVRLAIALAFADASVAVLALPQIVNRLHASISHVTWVITAYNLALIATTLAMLPIADRLANRRALVGGLTLFGLASLGSGAAGSLSLLIVWRCVQGVGGGLLLCASLPLFAREGRRGYALLHAWATTAAFGAAVGPATGGILTQVFDWRAIFFAQAPVAAAAAVAAFRSHVSVPSVQDTEPEAELPAGSLRPAVANVALLLVSAGLIGALFLSTVLLINVWQMTPLAAAAVLVTIPVATAITGHWTRERSATLCGAAGAVIAAVGLLGLSEISHRDIVLAVVALAVCGAGLGLAFPPLTRTALHTRGQPVARAARTVAAREGGLVLGLLVLTPILVAQLNGVFPQVRPPITKAVILGPGTLGQKIKLGAGLINAANHAPQAALPDIGPAFTAASQGASPSVKAQFAVLRGQLHDLIQRAATDSFHWPLRWCAVFSLLALVPIAFGSQLALRRARE